MNINENISIVEARKLIEIVSTLAKGCAFTKLEFQQIASICNKCIDRLEKEEGGINDSKRSN